MDQEQILINLTVVFPFGWTTSPHSRLVTRFQLWIDRFPAML